MGTTATQICPYNNQRTSVLIINSSAVTVSLGGAGVTTLTGAKLVAGADVRFTTLAAIYGVVASSTAGVGFLEETTG